MEEQINQGDVVQLADGTGPEMTVEKIKSEKALCAWWNPQMFRFDRGEFSIEILKAIPIE